MAITLRGFGGEIPKLQSRYLPDSAAVTATDLRLNRGDLEPIRGLSAPLVVAPGNRAALYRAPDGTWLTFTDATTRVVQGPVQDSRLYITSAAAPKLRTPNAVEYPLALLPPTTAPVLSRTGTLDPELQELVLYCYTFVTAWAEESQPSPAAGVFWSPGCTINLASMAAPPTGRNITRKRIYRSQTSTSGMTEFFFVAEIVGSDTGYGHSLSAAPIQEAIPSSDFDPPPAGLQGLTAMPNGVMAAFVGKEVMFCEPYMPHAWPVKYRQTVTAQIVALAAFGSSLAILTTGQPWVAQGLHPEQMAMEKMEQPFPCIAALGVVDMGYAALFPSTDGLVEVTQSGARLLTENVLTREQWDALAPATFRAEQWGGRYIASHQPGGAGARKMLMIDPRAQPPSMSRSDLALPALCLDQASGNLFALGANLRDVVQFDAPAAGRRSYVWRSKPYFQGRALSHGAVFIEATDVQAGSEVRVYGDGALVRTITSADFNSMARMPAIRASEWQVEVVGTSTITRIALGANPAEVMQ